MSYNRRISVRKIIPVVTAMYAAAAFGWSDVLLTGPGSSFVERDADGNPVYLTNATGWYSGSSPASAFDGDTATYADPKGASSWIGIALKEPQFITRIRYSARPQNNGYGRRIVGALIEGANKSDFSDAVLLHTVAPPEGWVPTSGFVDAAVNGDALGRSFRYLRIRATGSDGCVQAGNPAELEFYGIGDVKLTDPANDTIVTNETGVIAISDFIDGGKTYYSGNIAEHLFDGDTATYADPNHNTAWIGIELTQPKVITRIRFHGRTNNNGQTMGRIVGTIIEGANTADFSDAVALHFIDPPEGWVPTDGWLDARVDASLANRAYKYLRVRSDGNPSKHAGNLAELEFYGIDAPSDTAAPAEPEFSAVRINGNVNLSLQTSANVYAYGFSLAVASGDADDSDFFNFYPLGGRHHVSYPCGVYEDATVTVQAGNTAGTASSQCDLALGYPLAGAVKGGDDAAEAFDGDTSTPCSLAAGGWAGLDFGVPCTVTKVRFTVADGGSLAGVLEVSDDADFANARTVATLESTPGAGTAGEYVFTVPVTARGMRFVASEAIDLTELEFSAAGPCEQPSTFSVARDGLTNQYAVLSWTLPENVSRTVIYRSFGVGGPWTEVADVDAVETWTDETAPVGVPCYYKLAFAVGSGESRIVGDMSAASVDHRRCRLLERDWEDMTQLKEGVSFAYDWITVNKVYTPSGGTAEDSLGRWTDGVLNNYANLRIRAAGFDFGTPHGIGFLRLYPRSGDQGQTRYLGIRCAGSNDGADGWETASTDLTVAAEDNSVKWHEFGSLSSDRYRYVYLYNPDNGDWNGQLAELQLFGWSQAELETYAVGATGLAVSLSGASVTLTWKDNGVGSSFNVERRTEDGSWTVVASGVTGETYTDTVPAADGTTYEYRVVAVKGDAAACSESAIVVPYPTGDGTGLYAEYRFPYGFSNVTDAAVLTRTDPTVDIAAADAAAERALVPGVDGSHTNVQITWTGKLIVPLSGDYRFHADADDSIVVYLDGEPVLYRNSMYAGEIDSELVPLTAGEHDIRMHYWQNDGASVCRLFWSGRVAREIIPSTQFKPVEPRAVPGPWRADMLTMNVVEQLNAPGDIRVNEDASIDVAYAGYDMNGVKKNGHSFIWQPMKGDFVMTTKITHIGPGTYGQKAGLMVKASLAADAPFDSLLMRRNYWQIACKRRTVAGGAITEPDNVDGQGNWVLNAAQEVRMRLERKGQTFTFSYRTAEMSGWKMLYTYDHDADVFGETVYVGMATSFMNEPDAGHVYGVPHYSWRFSDYNLRHSGCFTFILR